MLFGDANKSVTWVADELTALPLGFEYRTTYADTPKHGDPGFMETTLKEDVEVRPTFVDRSPAPTEMEVLQRQRIRYDGFFTGPTW